jgi:hypothetical protein
VFQPPRCPYHGCAFHASPQKGVRWFVRNGHFRPLCRSQPVPRFRCLGCRRSFSRQSFRMDYRDHRPHLNAKLLALVASGVSLRKAARRLRLSNRCLELKVRKLAASSAPRATAGSGDPAASSTGELLGYSAAATLQRATRARAALAVQRAGGFLTCSRPPSKRARRWPLRKLDSSSPARSAAPGGPRKSRISIRAASGLRCSTDRERRAMESPCGVRCHTARPESGRKRTQALADRSPAAVATPPLRPRARFAYKGAARGTAAQLAGSR